MGKVTFNIASEASKLYISSGQKFIENAKNGQFGEFVKPWSLRSNSVTGQVIFNRAKIGGKYQNSNETILGDFQTLWITSYPKHYS